MNWISTIPIRVFDVIFPLVLFFRTRGEINVQMNSTVPSHSFTILIHVIIQPTSMLHFCIVWCRFHPINSIPTNMTPVGRNQALKRHALSHMEEKITRRPEKSTIRTKKIIIIWLYVKDEFYFVDLADVEILITTALFPQNPKVRNRDSNHTHHLQKWI